MRPPLLDWQATELAAHGDAPKRAVFASPRLGKTRLASEWLSGLPEALYPLRALVITPLSVAPAWTQELKDAGFVTFDLYNGPSKKRISRIFGPGVGVVNDDVVANMEGELMDWEPDAIIRDESHRDKSPSSRRGRAYRRLAWQTPAVRILTGTPTPNHYGDLWGQMVGLDKEDWGRSYERFARRFLLRDYMFPSRIVGYRDLPELQALMLKWASVYRREDVFGPDTWQTVNRTITLPPEARRIYDQLAYEWIATVEGEDIAAEHVLARLTRLQQVSAGFLPKEDGTNIVLHRAKLDAVLADLDEIVLADEKAVVFHRFRWEGETYQREIQRICPVTWRIGGDTSADDRAAIVERFASEPGPRVVVVQTQAGGLGISFAEGTHALFTSRGFSFTDDEQARNRIYKPGARRVVTYYTATDTIEEYIARVLANKEDVHHAIRNADHRELVFGKGRT